jgi:hypothetical protein
MTELNLIISLPVTVKYEILEKTRYFPMQVDIRAVYIDRAGKKRKTITRKNIISSLDLSTLVNLEDEILFSLKDDP